MHRPSTSQFLPVISLFPLPLVCLSVGFVWLVERFHITSPERNCATEFNGQRSSDWPSAEEVPQTHQLQQQKKCNGHDKTDQRITGTGRAGRGRETNRQTFEWTAQRKRCHCILVVLFHTIPTLHDQISGSLSNDVFRLDCVQLTNHMLATDQVPVYMNLHETELRSEYSSEAQPFRCDGPFFQLRLLGHSSSPGWPGTAFVVEWVELP
jgi:hypothetical protein